MARQGRQDHALMLERRAKVAALRLAGVRSQRKLAQQLGVSLGTINSDCKALDAEYRQQAAADIVTEKGLDLARIEAVIMALWPNRQQARTAEVLRGYLERRAKVLGYDAPEHVNVTEELSITRIIGVPDEELA